MMRFLRNISIAFVVLLSLVSINSLCTQATYAAWNKDSVCNSSVDPKTKEAAGCNTQQDTQKTAPNLAIILIDIVIGVLGVVAVGFIIFSGFRYLSARGDPGTVAKARNSLIFSVVGLVVAILAFAIVNFIASSISG